MVLATYGKHQETPGEESSTAYQLFQALTATHQVAVLLSAALAGYVLAGGGRWWRWQKSATWVGAGWAMRTTLSRLVVPCTRVA